MALNDEKHYSHGWRFNFMIVVKSSRQTRFWVLIFSLLLCGIISLLLGKEVQYDLANYHYYNPFAFFNHRWDIDYWPPTNQPMYLNPTIDFLTYFLIKYFSPLQAGFLLGAIHGINVWLLFLLSYQFLQHAPKKYVSIMALSFAIVGMYGPVSFIQIGSYMGDNLISIFVLAALILQIRYLHFANKKILLLSGCLLGIGIGLKLIASIYVIGFVVANLTMHRSFKQRCWELTLWGFALSIGILISSGYWMWFLWQHFQSPTFPYFNQIFKAPDFPFHNWRDVRFLPKDIWQTLFFPFYFSWTHQTSELPFFDIRFPIVYLMICYAAYQYLRRKLNTQDALTNWLVIFFMTSYVVWQWYFSNMRYLCVLQLIAPLIIYLLASISIKAMMPRFMLVACSLLMIMLTMQVSGEQRIHEFGNSYFNIKLPATALTPTGTVFVAFSSSLLTPHPLPQSYLIPSFPSAWRFIGVGFNTQLQAEMTDKITQMAVKVKHAYLLSSPETMPNFLAAVEHLGYRAAGPCERITSNRAPDGVLFCPIRR